MTEPLSRKISEPTSYANSKEKQFLEKVDKLLDDMSRKVFSFDFMEQISTMGKIDGVKPFIKLSKFKEAADRLVSACTEIDIRVREYYLPVLKLILDNTIQNQEAVDYVFNLDYFKKKDVEKNGGLPNLKDSYRHYNTINFYNMDLEFVYEALKKGLNPTNKEIVCKKLQFLLMISPKCTSNMVISKCLSEKFVISDLIEIFRYVPAFFKLEGTLPLNKSSKCLLVVNLFHYLFTWIDWQKKETRAIFETLLLKFTESFFQKKVGMFKRECVKPALFSANELLNNFICFYLGKLHPQIQLKIKSEDLQILLLNVLRRMFAKIKVDKENEFEYDSLWVISWNTSKDSSTEDSKAHVNCLNLISTLFTIYIENLDNIRLKRLIKHVFLSLANKLRDDYSFFPNSQLIFDSLPKREQPLKRHMEHCASIWLSKAFSNSRL